VVDLFAGCGGGSRGFVDAGFRVVGAVEIDADAADAYKANVGAQPLVCDIRAVDGMKLLEPAGLRPGELTLLFGCPPCQSFTILRRGAEVHEKDRRRNELPAQYLRLVGEVLPRHLAFENVPGMVEGRWRPHFDELLTGLKALGYRWESGIVDAADYGVPQRRRRLLAVASRVAAPGLPPATHTADGSDEFVRYRTVRDVIGGLPPLKSGEADPVDPFHRARRHSQLALDRLRVVPEGGGRKDLPEELQLECHKEHDGHYDIYGRMWWDRPAPTLTSGCTNVTRGKFGHPEQDRAITLREAMLLQGFPRDAVLRGGVEAMALQVGNAVPPPLAKQIGRQVLAMERMARTDVAEGRPSQAPARNGKANVVAPRRATATRSRSRSAT
jgi:DNA (cytosine-5)-methyltransferase 1